MHEGEHRHTYMKEIRARKDTSASSNASEAEAEPEAEAEAEVEADSSMRSLRAALLIISLVLNSCALRRWALERRDAVAALGNDLRAERTWYDDVSLDFSLVPAAGASGASSLLA